MAKTWHNNTTSTKVANKLQELNDSLIGINHAPTVNPVSRSILDDSGVITGNVITGYASDLDGNALSVTTISFGSVAKTVGTAFTTTYGTFQITSNGNYTYTPNATALALRSGQTASEVFTYTISDTQNANTSTTLTINVTGQNTAPIIIADTGQIPYNTVSTGNVLTNDSSPDARSLTLTQYSINSIVYSIGSTATITSIGSFILNSNGAWSFTPVTGYAGTVPVITYTVTDSIVTTTNTLTLTVSQAPTNVVSDPVTYALTGTRTFNAGPGQTYLELDTVPWSSLQPGDVVNIFYRSTPYVVKIGIGAQGTSTNKIIINGVTDSNGNRPIISGDGARTASTSASVFHGTAYESLGVITVVNPQGSSATYRPCWINIQNLQIMGARENAATYDSSGALGNWGTFGCGLWLNHATDMNITNCVINDNCLGIFSNSQAGGDGYGCERINLYYNRVYGNGVVGDDHQHNIYHQCYDTIVEGNYLGKLRPGAFGGCYKSRSGKEVVRFNWIEGTGGLMDMVQADNYYDGMVLKQDYGTSWVYGNVLMTDENWGGSSYRLIHFGGDNQGEQDATGTVGTSPTNYRMKLYFWNNTVFANNTASGQQYLLKCSYAEQTVEWWNNIVLQTGPRSMHTMHYSGTLNLRGTNIFYSNAGAMTDWAPETDGSFMHINQLGTKIVTDPMFNGPALYDFSLATGSPALDVSTSYPSGIPSNIATDFPLTLEPAYRTNGNFTRSTYGNVDLGPLELIPGAPPRSAPASTAPPPVSATGYAPGSTLHCDQGVWLYQPTAFTFQWQRSTDGGTVFSNISGQTSQNYVATLDGVYRCIVTATNIVNSTSVYSTYRTITSIVPASLIQFKKFVNSGTSSTATFTTNPTVGNTLVLFTSGVNSLSDNLGHTWVKAITGAGNSYDPGIYDHVWTTTVTTAGSMTITGTGVNNVQCGVACEVNGTIDKTLTIVGDWAPTSGTINVTQPGEFTLGSIRYGKIYAYMPPTPTLGSPFILDTTTGSATSTADLMGVYHANASAPGNWLITQPDTDVNGAFVTTYVLTFLPL